MTFSKIVSGTGSGCDSAVLFYTTQGIPAGVPHGLVMELNKLGSILPHAVPLQGQFLPDSVKSLVRRVMRVF